MAFMGAEIHFDKDKCLVRKNGQEFVIGSLLRYKMYIVNSSGYVQVSTANSAPSLPVGGPQLHLYKSVDGLNYDADTHSQKKRRSMCSSQDAEKAFPKIEPTQGNQTI